MTEEPRRFRHDSLDSEHGASTFNPAIGKPLGARFTGNVLVFLTAICMVLTMIGLIVEWFRLTQVQAILARGMAIDAAEAEAIDRVPIIVGFVTLAGSLVAGVAMLFWFHRAYRNLEVLGCVGRATTPGWVVGSFFIPIANLFQPYQFAQEIWRGSDPKCLDDYAWTKQPGSPLILLWWITRLASIIVDRVAASSLQSNNIREVIIALQLLMAAYAIGLVVDVLLITMVLRVSGRQDMKYDLLYSTDRPEASAEFRD